VTLSNFVISGVGNNISNPADFIAGIYYEDSSGTISDVATELQADNNNGVGILLEGGASAPSVTVENCDIQYFDKAGIWTETNAATSELTATIKNSFFNSGLGATGFVFQSGSTVTATNNSVTSGIELSGAAGEVTNNTFLAGLTVAADGAMVFSSNKLLAPTTGVQFNLNTTTTEVEGNTIVGSGGSGSVGIELACHTMNSKVHSNTIINYPVGVDALRTTITSANTYFAVAAETTPCT